MRMVRFSSFYFFSLCYSRLQSILKRSLTKNKKTDFLFEFNLKNYSVFDDGAD